MGNRRYGIDFPVLPMLCSWYRRISRQSPRRRIEIDVAAAEPLQPDVMAGGLTFMVGPKESLRLSRTTRNLCRFFPTQIPRPFLTNHSLCAPAFWSHFVALYLSGILSTPGRFDPCRTNGDAPIDAMLRAQSNFSRHS